MGHRRFDVAPQGQASTRSLGVFDPWRTSHMPGPKRSHGVESAMLWIRDGPAPTCWAPRYLLQAVGTKPARGGIQLAFHRWFHLLQPRLHLPRARGALM